MSKCVELILIFWGLFVLVPPTWSMTITPGVEDNYVFVVLNDIPYPVQRFEQELQSGLPTTITYSVCVMSQSQTIVEARLVITVIYDLWDEVYYVKKMTGQGIKKSKYRDLTKLTHNLKNVHLNKFVPISRLKEKQFYIMEVTIVLNPIARERIKRIQKWVADHGVVPLKSASPGADSQAFSSTGPRFKRLFDKIFEQYTNTDKDIGIWKVNLKSSPFKKEELKHGE